MRINKGTYLFIALLLAFTAGKAQLTMPFSMAPIASSGKLISSGGNPIQMDGKSKCLNVSSGLRVLEVTANSSGAFGSACLETPPVASVIVELTSVNLYPNPTHSTSILKVAGMFDANLSCQVQIFTIDGKLLFSKMVAMKEVQAGYTLNVGSYAQGTYVVSLQVMDQKHAVKLIKY